MGAAVRLYKEALEALGTVQLLSSCSSCASLLHFSLDPWHPCPCRDAAVTTTMTQWRYDDYCIVDYSGCGMHYDTRCEETQKAEASQWS
eukprot:symbB.v1.2.009881.t1/scaffold639.1/size181572/2